MCIADLNCYEKVYCSRGIVTNYLRKCQNELISTLADPIKSPQVSPMRWDLCILCQHETDLPLVFIKCEGYMNILSQAQDVPV